MSKTLPSFLFFLTLLSNTALGEPSKLLSYFEIDAPTRGNIVTVQPPEGIQPYLDKVQEAASKDPVWFAQYSQQSAPGMPLPFHEKLGLTQEEYDEYLEIWAQRDFVSRQPVSLLLEEDDGKYTLRVSGQGWPLSLLSYDPVTDTWQSTNGKLKAIADIDAPAESILGAWSGHEWRLESSGTLSTLKENIAVGKEKDGELGFLVYRLQEMSAKGRPLDDKSLVIRFVPKG